MPCMITVYISIGNSDDQLTQQEWASFVQEVDVAVNVHADQVHGRWLSPSAAPWQNACWCVEVTEDAVSWLRDEVAAARRRWRQDSAAWAVAPVTEFV